MKKILYAFCSVVMICLQGCYPSGPEYAEELDVVYTAFDEAFDFDVQATYAMPDKIVIDVTIDQNGDTTYVYMKEKYATAILNKIDDNMQSYGWTKVATDQSPDMVITPAGISNTNYFYNWWYNWWYPYYYWGWYYPPYFTISSYTVGTMILVMSHPEEDSPIGQSLAPWISVSNGILTNYNDIDRATGAIDQSFEQSPYLKIN
ncbi:DUF4136 domain-containing protein [Reichenbachiella agarivorans]|uniref:DUF4136 domain-containing protein n=1 Tax=Reichenbachiella agarivorans TaxID=2979464 RepID=A0ABY6CN32_9BACT|nr:DUF4136 domain-containing protein [Reichenbachiella agarivorans]UXP31922.1 DUF4136 domain-containing protein [Reichenbachiella agarivorans]